MRLRSYAEVAEELGVKVQRIWYLVASGKVPKPAKIGMMYVMNEHEVQYAAYVLKQQGSKWTRKNTNEKASD